MGHDRNAIQEDRTVDNTPNSEERFDKQVEQASDDMLAGRDTPWVEREPHRGEAAFTEGSETIDPVAQGPGGVSGGGSFGESGAHQGSSASESNYSGADGPRGENTPGAFAEEGKEGGVTTGADTRDNAVKKLQDL